MEPASPLKSLTTQLAPSNQQAHFLHNNSSHHKENNGSVSSSTNSLRMPITLTPPISLRLTSRNNPSKINATTAAVATAVHPNNNFQQQFSPDDNNSLFTNSSNNMQQFKIQNKNNNNNNINNLNNNHNNNNNNVNNNNNLITNGIPRNNGHIKQQAITKNRLNATNAAVAALDQNNKFTPDTEFVADFGSVNVFATTITKSTTTINGFSENNHKFMNGGSKQNGNSTNEEMANANFADFDHNPIYNAAGNLKNIF